MEKDANLNFGVSEELKEAIEEYSQSREISQASAVRLILRENLPTIDEWEATP